MAVHRIKRLTEEAVFSRYKGHTVLVTGANGFVAGHLMPRLVMLGSMVHGIDLQECGSSEGHIYHCCDLSVPDETLRLIEEIRPDFVFHLASKSSVGSSWNHEWETIEDNVKSTYNLFNALENLGSPVRLLLISTGEVYGDLLGRKAMETDRLLPMNPYAVSKAMMEMVAHRFQNTNIYYIIARSYNHTGPGRPEIFFEANMVKQFVEARRAEQDSLLLKVGNIDNIRDYSDVRDVVEKYILLACQGGRGEAYNVCSSIGTTLREIVAMIEEISHIKARIEVDASRLRRNDIPYLVGFSSIQFDSRPLTETIRDLYRNFLDGI